MCGAAGTLLYSGLRDTLHGAPGEWRIVRCREPRCGVLWLDPQPLEADIARAYADYHTHEAPLAAPTNGARRTYRWLKDLHLAGRYGYATRAAKPLQHLVALVLGLFPDRREFIEGEVMHLPALPGGRLLDVGCGSGRFMLLMRRHNWQVRGVDFDPAAIEVARAAGLQVALGDLGSCRFERESFDAVAMNHVIEHVFDPTALMRESLRILRPGGRLTIVTPNAAGRGHAIFRSAWRGLEPPRHIQIFTPEALVDLAKRAGFGSCAVWTSARARGLMARQSLEIARVNAGGAGPPLSLRAAAWGLKLLGRARAATDPRSGEEIMLVATK
jgi:SAM-dependent methyltransferase